MYIHVLGFIFIFDRVICVCVYLLKFCLKFYAGSSFNWLEEPQQWNGRSLCVFNLNYWFDLPFVYFAGLIPLEPML